MFQVKVISSNVRKTIVPSFMFLFNLLKSVVLCLNKENVNIIQFLPLNGPHWTNEITNKCTWFSCKIFVFYRKWKIKNVAVLHVWSAAHLEAFLLKQGMLFLARLKCFRHAQRYASAIAHLICQSLHTTGFYLVMWNWTQDLVPFQKQCCEM